jgi:hypothetical protein
MLSEGREIGKLKAKIRRREKYNSEIILKIACGGQLLHDEEVLRNMRLDKLVVRVATVNRISRLEMIIEREHERIYCLRNEKRNLKREKAEISEARQRMRMLIHEQRHLKKHYRVKLLQKKLLLKLQCRRWTK